MAEATPEQHRSILLQLFPKNKDYKLSYTDLKGKFGPKKKPPAGLALEESAVDQLLTGLIDEGFLKVTGSGMEGLHPRPNGSYRLTSQGKELAKEQARPSRPDHHSQELLDYQEAFLLLQIFRAESRSLTRSKINEKLKSKAALQSLEFDPKADSATVDHHLFSLVEKGLLEEQRRGPSVTYLMARKGLLALATAKQHEAASFTLKGEALNELLTLARESNSGIAGEGQDKPIDNPGPESKPTQRTIGEDDILRLVAQLKSGEYAGRDLIPIHELRRLVAQEQGANAASHSTFDPLVKRLRSEDRIRLIAISDLTNATREQLDDSITGMNETLFYIVVE